MLLKQKISSLVDQLTALPKKVTIPAAIFIIGAIMYSAFFIVEKPIVFSYASDTCISRLTLLPTIHRSSTEAGYKAEPKQLVSLGDWPIAARSVCVTPVAAPDKGGAKVSLAPYGGVFARQTFVVNAESPVVADVSPLNRPIPVSRPLTLRLSGNDKVFSYMLKLAEKQTVCVAKAAVLSCPVEKLSLAQSKTYPAKLVRQFDGKDVATMIAKDIQTLSATSLTDSSVKSGETVYAKPTEVSVSSDKKLVHVDATLYRLDGATRVEVPSSAIITDSGFAITIATELPRSSDYELIVKKVEAVDGSGLVQPHVLAFKTSGGPRVSSVNAGTTGVPMGSTVSVSFDQALSEKQDVSKYLSVAGGVTLTGRQGNQLLFSVAGVPKCGDFSIKLTNDLQSQYDIAGHSAWSYTARTTCHTIASIGTSSQGRAINAYYFGSGATTVLYTGAIHGSESSTKSLMDRWIQELEAKARSIPAHITVVIVPTLNPDGIARSSRTNARNVDLNRNFATSDWQKDITTVNNQPFPGGGGESAMSEPETQAISGLAQRLRPKVILSYHSIGSMVAANQAGNSATLAATYAQLSGYQNITGQSDTTFEYSVTGTADDWYAQALGVPSLLIELGSHSYHQFERNQAAMWAMINS
jgi:predicted deacylase